MFITLSGVKIFFRGGAILRKGALIRGNTVDLNSKCCMCNGNSFFIVNVI